MTHLATTSRELADALTDLIDSSHGSMRAACMALAGGMWAASEGGTTLEDDSLAQRVGDMIHIELVGERLRAADDHERRPDPQCGLQRGVWERWCQMTDWEAVGAHYLAEFEKGEGQ